MIGVVVIGLTAAFWLFTWGANWQRKRDDVLLTRRHDVLEAKHEGRIRSLGKRWMKARCVYCGKETTRLVVTGLVYAAGRYDGTIVCEPCMNGTCERLAECSRCAQARAMLREVV